MYFFRYTLCLDVSDAVWSFFVSKLVAKLFYDMRAATSDVRQCTCKVRTLSCTKFKELTLDMWDECNTWCDTEHHYVIKTVVGSHVPVIKV